jgi:predicted nucleic acid-binding protein
MASSALVDAGFLIALLNRRDAHHDWAVAEVSRLPQHWMTCEAALSEAFYVLGTLGSPKLAALIRRGLVVCTFRFGNDFEAVLRLLDHSTRRGWIRR